tara:strand:+ start:1239 stop:1556 length:318 start_codon:yes stop_codon:yes gene_type:complete
MKTKGTQMKANLQLEEIKTLGSGVKIAHLVLVLKEESHDFKKEYKISGGGYAFNVNGNYGLYDLNILLSWLDSKDNEQKVRDFTNDMLEADAKLKTTLKFNWSEI